MSSFIKGLGYYLPERRIFNTELERVVDTSDQWIFERTGIKSRHIAAPEQMSSDLALEAAQAALKSAGVEASELQAIIVATATPDVLLPQTSCILQRKLKASRALAFDLSAACSGFIYGLSVADGLIKSQNLENVLVVGAETLSKITNFRDRDTCVLFGDGAGAAVLGRAEDSIKSRFTTHLMANGELGELITAGITRPSDPFAFDDIPQFSFIKMQGREVFKNAVKTLTQSALTVLDKAQLTVFDIDWLIPHQANNRIMSSVADQLKISEDKVVNNIADTGNTSSASIPVAMTQYFEAGKIKRGDKILMTAFGAGVTTASAVFEF